MKKICLIALIIGTFGLGTTMVGMDEPTKPLVLTLSSFESRFPVVTVANYSPNVVNSFEQNHECKIKNNQIEMLNLGDDFQNLQAMLKLAKPLRNKSDRYTMKLHKDDAAIIPESRFHEQFTFSDQRLMTLFRNHSEIEIKSEDKDLKDVTVKFGVKTSGAGVWGSDVGGATKKSLSSSSSSNEDLDEPINIKESLFGAKEIATIEATYVQDIAKNMWSITEVSQTKGLQNYRLKLQNLEDSEHVNSISLTHQQIADLLGILTTENSPFAVFKDSKGEKYKINMNEVKKHKDTLTNISENARQTNVAAPVNPVQPSQPTTVGKNSVLSFSAKMLVGIIAGISLLYAASKAGAWDKTTAPFIEKELERLINFLSQIPSRMKSFASRN